MGTLSIPHEIKIKINNTYNVLHFYKGRSPMNTIAYIDRYALSLHGLSADRKFGVRTTDQQAVDQQFEVCTYHLPAARRRSWKHTGIASNPG